MSLMDAQTEESGEADADSSDLSSLLIYIIPAAASLLCILALCISIVVIKRIKRH